MALSSSISDRRRVRVVLCSTVAVIFVAEVLVVFLLSRLPAQSMWIGALLAAAALSILTFPAVYFFALRPIGTHGARHRLDKRALADSESSLAQADAKYQSIFEASLHGIYQSTPDGRFITANRGLARILGYDSVEDLMDSETDAGSDLYACGTSGRSEFLTMLAQEAGPAGCEYEILRRDGSRRWLSEHARTVRDADGALAYYEGTLTDITERVQAQRALQESERSLKETQAIAGLGSYVLDISTGRWTSSDVLDRIIGIDAGFDRCIDASKSLVHPDWRDIVANYFMDEVIEAHRPFDVEYQIVRQNDGETRWVHGLGRLECDDQDRPIRVIGTVQDITDRKRSEERLRQQADLLDQAQDAIVVRDMEHRITYWNNGAERLYGWSAAEAVGRAWPELICKAPDMFQAAHATVLRTGEWTGELLQGCKDGREVSVDSRWTMVRDRSGAPKSVLVINTDISGRKKLEGQFLRAQRLESIGLLAGGIAHDLNNVLSPIMMAVDLLKLTATDDNHALLETISASTQRGAEMVKGVLSFARGLEGRRMDIQVRQLVREIEGIARETFPKDIEVRTTLSRDLWTVAGDPTQLHRVLLNLCINARDAMPAGGHISITARNVTFDAKDAGMHIDAAPGRYVVIQVNDVGTGIPPSIIDKIFDPFFTTKEVGKGTGLGLSTSRAIVKDHGGFVRVASAAGSGAQFQVFLPALPEGYNAQAEAARPELPRGDGEMVLIVDDEAAVREITRQTLEAFGYRVLLASHGAEALALYAQHLGEIAIVVTDLLMPVMDGAATIRALKKLNRDVRVIAVSGSNDNISSAPLPHIAAGVIPILKKPYSPETLLQALRQAIVGQHVEVRGSAGP